MITCNVVSLSQFVNSDVLELGVIIIILLLVLVLWPLILYVLPDMLLEDKDKLPSGELSSWPIIDEVES